MKKFILVIVAVIMNTILFGQAISINKQLKSGLKQNINMTEKTSFPIQFSFEISDTSSNFELNIINTSDHMYNFKLNRKSMIDYSYHTCILPSSSYSFELRSGNENFSIIIKDAKVYSNKKSSLKTACGADNRILSNDPRSARMVVQSGQEGGNCTAQLLSNGYLAMSGHCVDSNDDGILDLPTTALVEFNVPLSTSGTLCHK